MKTLVIMLSPEELLSISPELRAKYCEAVPKQVPPATRTIGFAGIEEFKDHIDSDVSCHRDPLEPGGLVVPDPYEVYLRSDAAADKPVTLTVARESLALRLIVG